MANLNLNSLNQIKKGKTFLKGYWVKHPTIQDESLLEELHEKFLSLAIKRGVKTEEQALKFAKDNGTWTETLEAKLKRLRHTIGLMEANLLKSAFAEAQRKILQDDINKDWIQILELNEKKNTALGRTAENWAVKMSSERYVLSLFFRDENLIERSWSDVDVEYMEEQEIADIFDIFHDSRKPFDDDTLKSMAISPYCQNLFECCSNCNEFFGKTVMDLTYYQQRFFLYLKNFNSIITQVYGKVSNDILSDWKELEKWAKSSEKAREQLENLWGRSKNRDVTMESLQKVATKGGTSRLEDAKKLNQLMS